MLLESLAAVEARYKEINKSIADNIDDYQKVAEFSKEKSDLEEIVEKANFYRQTLKSIEEAESLMESDDEDMRTLAQEDLEKLQPLSVKLEEELKNLLVPKDPRDRRNVIIEIRAGPAATKPACLPQICSVCIRITLRTTAGKLKCFPKMKPALAA